MQHELEYDDEPEKLEAIAVIGYSLRFPQKATSPELFWSTLVERRCTTSEWPKDRLNFDAFYHPDSDRKDTIPVCGAHFLEEDLAAFDAPFFSITSAEAVSMDPQQRGLLEITYHAVENAGLSLEKLSGSKTGVYTGSFADDYKLMILKDPEALPRYAATGGAMALLANRVSWFFNLVGPSVNLDTACSSSMMALDLACQGLRDGESTMALVAGSNTIFGLDPFLCLTNMNFLSPDGRCYSFDERANGYARGEGFGVVVIKLVKDAIRDGDTIRAVIRSTSSNQDGRTPGITQPSRDAQETLIKSTYKKAGLSPRLTRYFEAHGTGTAVGDPTEAGAIGRAFREYRSREDPLYIGAVKSNIGHLEGASGIAGLIKTIMVLEKGVIPPNANFERLNSKIDADFLNLKFPLSSIPWPHDALRRASVNSFGFGGTNSHAILDDAFNFLRLRNLVAKHSTAQITPALPEAISTRKTVEEIWRNDHIPRVSSEGVQSFQPETVGSDKDGIYFADDVPMGSDSTRHLESKHHALPEPRLLVWSAADEHGLDRLSQAYTSHFSQLSLSTKDVNSYVDNLAYTLAARRSSLPWKSYSVVKTLSALSDIKGSLSKSIRSTGRRSIGFIFTGQGAQFSGMGRELLAYPVFQDVMRQAEDHLSEWGCEWSLIDEMLKEKQNSKVDDPEISQPLCTALQIALVELLRSSNLYPTAVVGHSSGEIAAAYCIGGLSLRSACKVAYFRGKLTAKLAATSQKRGAMMAVGLSEVEVRPFLDKLTFESEIDDVSIACINSPRNVTLAGPEVHIDVIKSMLHDKHVFVRKLQVEVAYHSPQMKVIANQYLTAIDNLEPGQPSKALGKPGSAIMISSVTTRQVSAERLRQSEYWTDNMVSPVRFADAVAQLIPQSATTAKKRLGQTQHKQVVVSDLLEIGPHAALRGPVKDILESVSKHKQVSYSSVLVRHVSALETFMDAMGHMHCLGVNIKVVEVNASGTKPVEEFKTLSCLPKYPFDHSQQYWYENRLSRQYRLRKWPRHDLLGTPVPDWNPLNARWRKFITVTETPWVADHKINGSMVYPAAGMLVMAIEGAQQIADKDRRIMAYCVEEATFDRAITIPMSEEGVETQLHILPSRASSNDRLALYDFTICVFENSHWIENCHGTIQVEYEEGETAMYRGQENEKKSELYRQRYTLAVNACSRNVDREVMYAHLQNMGFNFGPAFQTLRHIACNDDGEAIAEVKTFQSTARKLGNGKQDDVIHPTTLDGVAQLFSVALTRGAQDEIPTTIPTRVRKLWISNSWVDDPALGGIQAYSKSEFVGYQGTESTMFALEKSTRNILLRIESLETTTVASHHAKSQDRPEQRNLCYSIDWKPDVDYLAPQQALSYCEARCADEVEPIDFYQELDLLLNSYILSALEETCNGEATVTPPYLLEYKAWMKWQSEKFQYKDLSRNQVSTKALIHDAAYIDTLSARVESHSRRGRFLVNIGRNLPRLISGETDPCVSLFEGSLFEDCCRDFLDYTSCCRQIAQYLIVLAHKNPAMKVMEVGAGTGGLTTHIISALSTHDEVDHRAPTYAKYDYTDKSRSMLEKAQSTFANQKQFMDFRELDIEGDLHQQGFEKGSYDLLIASSVLHAPRSLPKMMRNIRSLLKPNGKLILFANTEPDLVRTGFASGLLPGWWLSAHKSPGQGPCISESQWRSVLSEAGFSEPDVVFRDYKHESCHEMSVLVSSAIGDASRSFSTQRCSLIIDKSCPIQQEFARMLKRGLQFADNANCEIVSMQAVETKDLSQETFYIFLLEIEKPYLHNLDTKRYRLLQKILCSAAQLLWVTGDPQTLPGYGMVLGLSRVLRSENSQLKFLHIQLENPGDVIQLHVENIIKILQFAVAQTLNDDDLEYMERDGTIYLSRLIEAKRLNSIVNSRTRLKQHRTLEFGHGAPLKLTIASPGLLDSLHFIQDDRHAQPLADYEVEVEVRAVGVNLRDCLIVLGRVTETTLGAEFAGIVSRTGGACHMQPGDRVCGCILGCLSTYVRGNAQLVAKIPDELAFVEAAAVPVTFITAWHALVEVARLQRGESILIHSASGGTGQAAIQIAKLLGAEVFVTVGFEEKKRLVMDLYNIAEDHVYYSRNKTFVLGIQRMTNGKGVDVVLNSLSGELLFASWECIAPYGRFLEIGKKDINANSKLPMFLFKKNVSFCTIDTAAMTSERPALIQKSLIAVMTLVTEKKLRTAQPLHVFPISEVEMAFRYMQGGNNTGKTIVEMNASYLVPTILDTKPEYYFDVQATYLIAGGLGGLGRSAARWMAQRGARNLILLSRSGPRTDSAADLVKELRMQGVHVETPACDVTSASSISSVLEQCGKVMPPVKGCIQGTMVLRDGIFETMSFENWDASVRSKVQGSWNLHTLLPKGMDFFILLSSIAGIIGSGGQANYAAGNTFMDALAHHRIATGEKAVSLDLGWMKSEGVVAENEYLEKGFTAAGFLMPIHQQEFHALLDYYCNPALERTGPLESQIVVGLETPAAVRAKGGDPPPWMSRPLFSSMRQIGLDDVSLAGEARSTSNYAALFKNAASLTEASSIVSDGLVNKLSRALSIPETDVDTNKALHAYGVDSLLAVELRNWFAKEFEADVAIFDIMGGKDFAAVALRVAEKSKLRHVSQVDSSV